MPVVSTTLYVVSKRRGAVGVKVAAAPFTAIVPAMLPP
jgi:hypothetical protein